MSFVRINGLALDVDYGSWREDPDHIGDLNERTLAGRVAEARIARARKWKCRTTPLAVSTAADAERLVQWIEGRGQTWPFDSASHSYSAVGVTNTGAPAGTLTRSATSGKYGGYLNAASTAVFGVDMSNKLGVISGWSPTVHGWTMMAWRKFIAAETAAAGYHHILLKGQVAFARGASANPVGVKQYIDGVLNGSANLGRVVSVDTTNPFTGIHGYDTNGAGAAIDWDDLVFVPYEVPDSWVSSIYAFHAARAWSLLPSVLVDGDYIQDASPVRAICRVTGAEAVQLAAGGTVKNNLRVFDLEIKEWVT